MPISAWKRPREGAQAEPGYQSRSEPLPALNALFPSPAFLKNQKISINFVLYPRANSATASSALSTEDRIRVEDEATQCVEQWEETDETRTNFTIRRRRPSITTSANEFWTSMRLTPVFGPTGKEPRRADVRCPLRLAPLRT